MSGTIYDEELKSKSLMILQRKPAKKLDLTLF